MITTPHRAAWRSGRSLIPTFALAALLAACTSGGPTSTTGPTASPPAVSDPASTSPSTGPGEPADNPPGGVGPGDTLVVPKPGQLDVHPIAADALAARVDGRHVILTISYTSGVEPCSVLDTIVVQRREGSFAITLREGHGPGDQVCIMIARVMKTQVDLGELQPGTYTISDTMRGADPIQMTVG